MKTFNQFINEEVENLEEKNKPTSPEKWARAKAAAKSKFAVYPSAYANAWASKKYKSMGGGWRSTSEEVEQIDELSKDTLKSYAGQALKIKNIDNKKGENRVNQRHKGMQRAMNRLYPMPTQKEEVVTEAKGIPVAHGYTMHQKHSGKYRVHSPSGEHVGDVEKEGNMWRYHGSSNPNWPGTESHKDYQTDKVENKHEAGDIVAHLHHSGIKNEEIEFYEQYDAEELFDILEEVVDGIAAENNLDSDIFWENLEDVSDEELFETAAWRRKEGKNPTGGLNRKGIMSYRRENPGSKLKMAVTGKVKPGSKAAKRRKSFCARMSGMKGPMKKPNGKPTRKALALRKWRCR